MEYIVKYVLELGFLVRKIKEKKPRDTLQNNAKIYLLRFF